MSDYLARTDNFMASLGLEVYRVGGSVRDELLGRRAKDADYVVCGTPLKDLGQCLARPSVKVSKLKLRDGRQAGWRVSGKGLGVIEVVLPRTEVSTGPGHRDFEIVIDPNLTIEVDARRRDFTFNALYRDVHSGEIRDPTQRGLYDLEHRLIHVTHDHSFRDDPLRMLRALRFISTLGYDLSAHTERVLLLYADFADGLTADGHASGTVMDEFSKLLMGADVAKALRIARDTGVLGTVFPELTAMLGFEQQSRYHDMTTDEHTFKALETAGKVDAPLRVRWALLFHDAGKPDAAWADDHGRLHYYENNDLFTEDHEVISERLWRAAATRLGAEKRLREDVATLIRHHMVSTEGKFKPSKVRRMRVEFGDEMLRDLLLHRACDISGKGKPDAQKLTRIAWMEAERQCARNSNVPASVGDLAIDGKDLMELGLQGKQIGEALRAVLHEVASQPTETTLSREWQLERAKKL